MNEVFDRERYGFLKIGDSVIVMRPQDRILHTKTWAIEIVGIDPTDFQYVTRGYFNKDRIQFFIDDYTTDTDIDGDLIHEVIYARGDAYGIDDERIFDVPVYNGVRKGEVGEVWSPCLKYNPSSGRWEIYEGATA